jgi:hypothetical protein
MRKFNENLRENTRYKTLTQWSICVFNVACEYESGNCKNWSPDEVLCRTVDKTT